MLPLSLKARATRAFLFLPLRGSLTMRDCYAGTAAAVRDALRHAVEYGTASSLGVLHRGVPSGATPTGDIATALRHQCGNPA
jgi:hypothetical protein